MIFKKLVPCCVLLLTSSLCGMTYDNRFFPLLDKPTLHQDDVHFFTRFQPFYMFASQSYNADGDERPLFNVFGQYNQVKMDNALILSNKIDKLLLPESIVKVNPTLPWAAFGKVDAAGLACRWYYSLCRYCDIGGSFFFAGTRSRLQYALDSAKLNLDSNQEVRATQVQQLYDIQQRMLQADGIKSLLWDSFGISDLDFYLRLGFMRHYFLKFKTFDCGARFGVIVPTAKEFEIDYPSSLIFGGDKQWGIYVDTALDTELKEDLFAGFNFRFIQRFKKTKNIRLPVQDVPNNLGILTDGSTEVSPGFTFVFSPYAGIANLREGFGLNIGYTLILHTRDAFKINANLDPLLKPVDMVKTLQERSKWGSEYITCSAVYDFAKDKECRGATPCVTLDIDIPISVVVAQQSFKTYGISLRIESDLW